MNSLTIPPAWSRWLVPSVIMWVSVGPICGEELLKLEVCRAGGGGLGRRARVQVAGPEAVPGRSRVQAAGDVGAGSQLAGDQRAGEVGAEQAGDEGADDLTAGSGTRRTHGGAQRHGAKTAGTFVEAVEICGGAAETQQAERVRPRTPQGQEQEVETGPSLTPPVREPGMEGVRPRSPPGQDREQEQEVEAVHPRAPHGQAQSVRAARLVLRNRTRNRFGVWRWFFHEPLRNWTRNRIMSREQRRWLIRSEAMSRKTMSSFDGERVEEEAGDLLIEAMISSRALCRSASLVWWIRGSGKKSLLASSQS
ncbi:hypothetical protein CRENBAI_018463 [Crenichthys baileyi]|uniref:Uncharacterized protein n=1 Tax=Crenichthys baileyi TaxID=28760 RepID=A0AAV9SC58_9TELE